MSRKTHSFLCGNDCKFKCTYSVLAPQVPQGVRKGVDKTFAMWYNRAYPKFESEEITMNLWELVDYLTFDEDDCYYWGKTATEADMKYQLEVMWEEDEIDTRMINPSEALETIRACVRAFEE